MRKLSSLLVGIPFFVLASLPSQVDANDSRAFVVRLDPKLSPSPSVNVKSKAQGWKKSGKMDGYVGFAKGDSGWIFFTVKGEEPGSSCGASDPDLKADWVITKILLSDDGDKSTGKGDNFNNSQDSWLQLAFPKVELSSGVVFDKPKADAYSFQGIKNDNGQEGFRRIYYQVEVTNCDTSEVASTDPYVGNGGKGN